MSEQLKAISQVRQTLPKLSQSAEKQMERYIVTQNGSPQSVLLGYSDYQGMKAAVELLQRPEVMEDIRAGEKQLDEGKRLSPEEAWQRLSEGSASKQAAKLQSEVASEAGVDVQTAVAVLDALAKSFRTRLATDKELLVPGVGKIQIFDAADLLKQGKRKQVNPGWIPVRLTEE